jgi:hypothetical protein
MWSLTQTLERLTPHLPEALASGAALARVGAVADRLPAALTTCLYLERFLRREPARLDLILRVDASARSLLAGPDRWAGAPADGGGWRRIAAFARAWSDPSTGLDASVEALWLEFDLPPQPHTWPPAPRVFVDFTRAAARRGTVDERCDLAVEVLGALAPARPSLALRRELRACLERLPEGAYVPYVGLSPARADAARVCVQGLRRDLRAYLGRVGWPGDPEGLARDVLVPLAGAQAAGADEAVHVIHLDLEPQVRPALGLEYAFARADQARGVLREAPLLDLLVARGWCDAAVRDAIGAWPGSREEALPHQIWPSRVERRVNHVKIVRAPDGSIEAKAYLAALVEPSRDARQPGAIE